MEGLVETVTVAFKTELTSFVNVPLDLLVKFAAFYVSLVQMHLKIIHVTIFLCVVELNLKKRF